MTTVYHSLYSKGIVTLNGHMSSLVGSGPAEVYRQITNSSFHFRGSRRRRSWSCLVPQGRDNVASQC
jgi:hypothetical protein